jgi:hypothetical protein
MLVTVYSAALEGEETGVLRRGDETKIANGTAVTTQNVLALRTAAPSNASKYSSQQVPTVHSTAGTSARSTSYARHTHTAKREREWIVYDHREQQQSNFVCYDNAFHYFNE